MHRNSCHVLGGWETDAYLLAITRPARSGAGDAGAVRRVLLVGGSYLRRDGLVLLDSLSKVFALFEIGQRDMEISLQGQPLIRLSWHTAERPDSVRVNGQAQPVQYDAAARKVTLRVGETLFPRR